MHCINCKGKLIVLSHPVVMGILNITPDSFYTGDLDVPVADIVSKAETMLAQGASIIDMGAQSTRPGSKRLSADEEWQRLEPVLTAVVSKLPDAVISVDTYHASVAMNGVARGASIVNDVSAGEMDPKMIPTVAALGVPYICMHMQGSPETMQQQPHYDDVVLQVLDYLVNKLGECRAAGIKDVIIDPGFGFGKTIAHNIGLLKHLDVFKMLDVPILAGLSRKATIYKTLGGTAADALNGTTVLNTIALQKGAHILRVHDVREAVECVKLLALFE